VPVCTPIVMEAARETCKESYLKSGHPDLFREDMVQYIADDQFAYVAGVNGIMQREKPAACFYQGKFYAESLILAETGNSIGAIQIAGTGSPAQIPFFVTACDFTLIGEEFFAASSYLSKKPELVGSIKGQDYIKLSSIGLMAICLILSIFRFFEYSNMDSWNEVKNKYEYDQVIIEWNNLDQNSQEILSGFKREDIINLNKKINYRFELIKESILSPHNQAMELKAFSPFIEPEVMIAIIEGISTEEELMNYFNDIMDISFNIKDMTNHAAEEFANIYYNSSLEMYDFNKVSPLNHKALINSLFNSLKSKIKFENLNETSKNTFLGSINVKSFDELTLKNKIRLVNLFVGEKIGVNSEINYPNEVLPVVMIDTTNLKQSRFKSMRIDDLSQLYHYIGEAQSLSFDVNDLFNLKVSK